MFRSSFIPFNDTRRENKRSFSCFSSSTDFLPHNSTSSSLPSLKWINSIPTRQLSTRLPCLVHLPSLLPSRTLPSLLNHQTSLSLTHVGPSPCSFPCIFELTLTSSIDEFFMNPLTPFIFGIVYFAVAKTLSHYQNGRNRIQGKRWNTVVVAHNVFLAVYSAWTYV